MKKLSDRREIKSSYFGYLFILPSLLGVGVFYLLPFLGSLFYTFTQGVAEPHFVGLENFRELAGNPRFGQAVRNTLFFWLWEWPD